MARRAFASEDKRARRDAILGAARVLFVDGDGGLPSVARVAAAAGLAKGTVYLYFRTKEDIFAALLLEGWTAALAELGLTLQRGQGERSDTIAAFLAAYASHLDAHPELLRLDALGYGVLERNMGVDSLRAFKLTLMDRLTEAGAAADTALALPAGHGLRLLTRTYALTRGLWQSTQSHGAPDLMAEPALAPLYPIFATELREALTEYWRGALLA